MSDKKKQSTSPTPTIKKTIGTEVTKVVHGVTFLNETVLSHDPVPIPPHLDNIAQQPKPSTSQSNTEEIDSIISEDRYQQDGSNSRNIHIKENATSAISSISESTTDWTNIWTSRQRLPCRASRATDRKSSHTTKSSVEPNLVVTDSKHANRSKHFCQSVEVHTVEESPRCLSTIQQHEIDRSDQPASSTDDPSSTI